MPTTTLDLNTVNWDQLLTQGQQGRGSFTGVPYQRGGQRGKGLGGVLNGLVQLVPLLLSTQAGQNLIGKPACDTQGKGSKRKYKRAVAVVKPDFRRHLSDHVKTARRQISKNPSA